jgi:pyruvate/oxaloacetate carboxyltransferase
MARRKRTSQVLEKAVRRAAGMSSIDPALELGNGLSLPAFSTLIETMRSKENDYNSALSNLDKLYREMLETERELGDMAEHMLLGVATRYGKSSVEYGMAGGVPKNQRRRGLRGETLSSNSEPPIVTIRVNHASKNGSQNDKKAEATNA